MGGENKRMQRTKLLKVHLIWNASIGKTFRETGSNLRFLNCCEIHHCIKFMWTFILGWETEDVCLLEENRMVLYSIKRKHHGINEIMSSQGWEPWLHIQPEVVFKISNNFFGTWGRCSSHRWPCKGNSKGAQACNDGSQPQESDGDWAFVHWVPTLLTEMTSS